MKIVIDIDEDIYKHLIQTDENTIILSELLDLRNSIRNGTPLPKGHGRLIDEKGISLSGIHFKTELDHARMIGRLNTAPAIVKADKAESEETK